MARTNALQLFAYAAMSTSALAIPIFAHDLGASLAMIGLMGSAHGVANVASNVLFGRWGDRHDRRILLLTGFGLTTFAFGLQYFAHSVNALMAVRVVVGFATGMIPATLVAYVYDIKRPLGKFTSFNAMGWLVGSLLISGAGLLTTYTLRDPTLEGIRAWIAAIGPYPLLFVASAVLSAIGYVVARGLAPMRIHMDVPLFPFHLIRANAPTYMALFLRHLGATAIWAIFPIFILEHGGSLALLGVLHVVNMVGQILLFRNAERVRLLNHPATLILIGLGMAAVVFGAFAFIQDANHLLWWQFPVGVSFAALWLGCQRDVLQRHAQRATSAGLLNASMSLSNVIGPLIGGLIAARNGYHATMAFGCAVTVLGFVVYATLAWGRTRAARSVASVPRPVGDVTP